MLKSKLASRRDKLAPCLNNLGQSQPAAKVTALGKRAASAIEQPLPEKTTKKIKLEDTSLTSKKSSQKAFVSSQSDRDGKQTGASRALSAFQTQLKSKLDSARFRWLNEQLYTTSGTEAFEMFSQNKNDFAAYHAGFSQQVTSWPMNPLDIFIRYFKAHPNMVVGDFGCGEARLASSVDNKVYSMDLVAVNPSVIACNMAHVPLGNKIIDAAVFCLSLMGTNFMEFLREAHRMLRPGGHLKIAEVTSRFDVDRSVQVQSSEKKKSGSKKEKGGKKKGSSAAPPQRGVVSESGIKKFVTAICELGFDFKKQTIENSIFVFLDFVRKPDGSGPGKAPKNSNSTMGKGNGSAPAFDIGHALSVVSGQDLLKPCIYKKR